MIYQAASIELFVLCANLQRVFESLYLFMSWPIPAVPFVTTFIMGFEQPRPEVEQRSSWPKLEDV